MFLSVLVVNAGIKDWDKHLKVYENRIFTDEYCNLTAGENHALPPESPTCDIT